MQMSIAYVLTMAYWFRFSLGYFVCFCVFFAFTGSVCLEIPFCVCFWCIFSHLF